MHLGSVLVQDTVDRYDLVFLNVLGKSTAENVHVVWGKRKHTYTDLFENLLDLAIESVGGNIIVAFKDHYDCQISVVGVQYFKLNSLAVFYMPHENHTSDYDHTTKGAGLNVVMSSCSFCVKVQVTDYNYHAYAIGSPIYRHI